MRFVKLGYKIISLVFRIICLVIGGIASKKTNDPAVVLLYFGIAETIVSAISLLRLSPDSIVPVITGWNAFGDEGEYEVTDNSGLRIVGVIALIAMFILRIVLIFLLIGYWTQGSAAFDGLYKPKS